MKNTFNKLSFGHGFALACCLMFIMGFTNQQEKVSDSEYHLIFRGPGHAAGFVYNSKTGEVKKIVWNDVQNGKNLKELLDEK